MHWRTSDSLSLDDPRLPKLWLEHSLLVNPCEKKQNKRFLCCSLFLGFWFQQPDKRYLWQSPATDHYSQLTLVPPLVLPVLPPVLPLTPPMKRASSSSCLRGSRLCSSSMVPIRDPASQSFSQTAEKLPENPHLNLGVSGVDDFVFQRNSFRDAANMLNISAEITGMATTYSRICDRDYDDKILMMLSGDNTTAASTDGDDGEICSESKRREKQVTFLCRYPESARAASDCCVAVGLLRWLQCCSAPGQRRRFTWTTILTLQRKPFQKGRKMAPWEIWGFRNFSVLTKVFYRFLQW